MPEAPHCSHIAVAFSTSPCWPEPVPREIIGILWPAVPTGTVGTAAATLEVAERQRTASISTALDTLGAATGIRQPPWWRKVPSGGELVTAA